MLNKDSTLDYKQGYRDALQMIIETAADANEGQELSSIMLTANRGIIEAENLINIPWY